MQMSVVTVRNLPEETHRALKARAKLHHKSTEAEIRSILEDVVRPKNRIKLGTELARFAQEFGGIALDITRDQSPIEPALFE